MENRKPLLEALKDNSIKRLPVIKSPTRQNYQHIKNFNSTLQESSIMNYKTGNSFQQSPDRLREKMNYTTVGEFRSPNIEISLP